MAAVVSPNYGLILDRPPINIPPRGLRDGINFRCKNGTLESRNLGWGRFSPDWVLNGPVYLIDNFFPRGLDEKLIFGTITDLYLYDPGTDTVSFLTPRYDTGTASASGTAVTGVGTTWSTNVTAEDEIHFGAAAYNTSPGTWFTILSVDSDTTITLTASAGTVVDGPYTIRRKFSATSVGEWSFDTFVNDGTSGDDLWFATNGIEPPVTWDGVATQVTLHPELGFTCTTLATYSNMMIYGNLTQAGISLPTSIINSDVGLPLNAGATGTGLSEQFVVHSGTDEILNMIPLGDYLVVYAARTLVPIQFIGDPLIFLFRVAISGVGPISANALADFGDFHEFIGADAGYLFDGVTLKETNSHVWRDVLRQTDPIRRRQAFGHFDEEQGDLIWSIPNTADAGAGTIGTTAEVAWPEHYLEDPGPDFEGSPFSKRDFPFTITGFYERATGLAWEDVVEQWNEFNFAWNDQFFATAFPLNIAGDINGIIWILNQTQTGAGAALPSFVRTGRMASSDAGRNRDLLTRIYPYARSLPYDLEVTLYMGDHIAGTPNSKGTVNFDMNLVEGEHFVTFYRRGRVREYQFGSAAGNPWVLDGWDDDVIKGGRR